MNKIQDGREITSAFHYIQQLSDECKKLILKIENHMAPDWINLDKNGSRITTGTSSSLYATDKWIFQSLFRTYENSQDKMSTINKSITITFWGDEIYEPIITAGSIDYSNIDKKGYWDLWHIWFTWSKQNSEIEFKPNGKIYNFMPKQHDYIKESILFSIPLVEINDEDSLIEKLIKPLKKI